MTVAQGWTLIAVLLVVALAQAVLLVRLVHSQVNDLTAHVDEVCAKIDQIGVKVDSIRRWLDSRDP